MSEAQEKVARGAAWLDEVKPGAIALMDPDTFDIANVDRCAAGQAFGVGGWNRMRRLMREQRLDGCCSHGFCGGMEVQDAWIALIRERQGLLDGDHS